MPGTKNSLKMIIKREGNLVPYDRDRIATAIFRAMASIPAGRTSASSPRPELGTKAGAPPAGKKADRKLADTLSLDVERRLKAGDGSPATPSVEDIQDIVERTLMENGQAETARAYRDYRRRRAQARSARAHSFEVTDNIPYKKIYEVLRWNMNHGCDSIAGLNKIITAGHFADLIRDSDHRYDEELEHAAELIIARRDKVRLIIVAGPSASGKTTTTMKLGEKLKSAGLEIKSLVMDSYFFDLDQHPRDESGDYDYESPQSLDLALINRHLTALLEGRLIKTPIYNFKTGQRTLDVNAMRLEKNQLLLLDSLHGLYHEMTKDVSSSCIFRIYIETLGQIRSGDGLFMRWADNRLMRRMIRDQLHRNSQPVTTLTHWHYVRRSELQNIIPFIATADVLINSALPYEIPVLKNKVFTYFPKAIEQYRDDPQRQDAYIRAKRIADFLSPLQEAADTTLIPDDSLLREFIGGSRYE